MVNKLKNEIEVMIRYFLYVRKSSEGDDKQVASIDSQINELKSLAEKLGIVIVEVIEESKSAKEPRARKHFNMMLQRIRAGEANGILCWKADRLARNPVDGGEIIWMLQKGIIQNIKTFQNNYYPTDNVLPLYVEFGVANQYVNDLSDNIRRGQRNNLYESGWYPHKAPIGYLNNKFKIEGLSPIYNDPERFNIVKKLWQTLITTRCSIEKLKIVGDEYGLRAKRGTKVTINNYYKIFKNPFYYGYFKWNDELYNGAHNMMISKKDFDLAQDIIAGKYKSKAKYKEFEFTGMIRCGECGSGITAEDKEKKCKNGNVHHYTYYHCTKKVKTETGKRCSQKSLEIEVMNEQFLNIINDITIPEEFHVWSIKALKHEQSNESNERNKILKSQQNAHGLIVKQLDVLFDMRMNKEIDADEYARRKNIYLSEKKQLEELIDETNLRVETWLKNAEELLNFAETAKQRFENGNLVAKRSVLISLGSNLILKDKKLSITLDRPLSLVSQLAPEVQALHSRLEPVQDQLTQDDYEGFYTKNEKWWR